MRTPLTLSFLLFGLLFAGQSQAQVDPPAAYSNTIKVNYIRTWDATAPDTNAAALVLRPLKDVKQTTVYFDGLGRNIQQVVKQGSLPIGDSPKDLTQAIVYDEFGRELYHYLPFAANTTGGNPSVNDGGFKQNPFQQQASFAGTQFPGETFFYGKTNYEASPLNRPISAYAAGNSWAGSEDAVNAANRHGIETGYQINSADDSVRMWMVDGNNISSTAAMYPAGELFKTVTTDEHKKQVIEYKDKDGLVILRKVQLAAVPAAGHTGWLCSYYVYDNVNLLRLVVPPKATQQLAVNSWSLTNTIRDELCFRYEYDQRNRMIRKKVPGAGEVWMVYDARDRLVMTQDSLLRGQHKWLYTLYDGLNRPTITGLLTDNTYYNNLSYHLGQAYSSTAYPNTASYTIEEQTKTYYDEYSSWAANAYLASATYINTYDSYLLTPSTTSWPYAEPVTKSTRVTGLPTGKFARVLGSPSFIGTVIIYDDKGRVIQTQANNVFGYLDVTTTQYNFSGQPLVVIEKTAQAANTEYVVVTKMAYDDLQRLATVKKTIHMVLAGTTIDQPEQTIVSNEYDALGQLKKKTLGNSLEDITNEYNIRGWLTSLNKGYVSGSNTSHYFGMEVGYDKTSSAASTTSYAAAQYNGNITGTVWKSAGAGFNRKYDFSYDAANRLTAAGFLQNTTGSSWDNTNADFSVSNLTFDANGNILTMQQKGWKPGTPTGTIDNLSYTYYDNSNKLKNVIDAGNDVDTKLGDFRSSTTYMTALGGTKTNSATDYAYDGNGNLIKDLNKDIDDASVDGIEYNYLNLPSVIHVKNKGTIEYTYDALGTKYLKMVHENGKPDKGTLYLRGLVFEDGQLQFISHEEGRFRWAKKYFTNGDSAYRFFSDYFIKDHLGNVRMVLTEQKDTAQYFASMETAYRTKEDALFANVSTTAFATASISGGYPTDATTTPNDWVAKVNGSGNKTGPALVLKVMSGDKLSIGVKSYFKSGGTSGAALNESALNDILASLASGVVGVAGDAKGTLSQLNNTGTSPLLGALGAFRTTNNPDQTSVPKAYLNWVLLDDQFNYVAGSSGAVAVAMPDGIYPLTGSPDITRNGFLYIYVSNETKGWDVFFDNLSVTHYTGPLTEETHYYPFGLTMAGISNKAFGELENRYKFNKGSELQNKEFSDGTGLEWYATPLRSLDPQLGRWWQIDSKPDYAQSPYSAMGNNPILFNDPLGDTLVFPGGSEEFIAQFYDAFAYLEANGVGDNLKKLAESSENFSVLENKNINEPSTFAGRTIFWNPRAALKTTNGNTISPATILDHEADHAVFELEHEAESDKLTLASDKSYDSKEEKRVITKREQKTALALGEIKKGQVTRTDHGGRPYLTTGPTTRNSSIEDSIKEQLEKKKQMQRKDENGAKRLDGCSSCEVKKKLNEF